ncbi:MAG: hypothetical protein J7I99_04115 [Methanophagales archaeon]|nr:hypothetical protein [Methanophagales archaeon]
MKWEYRRYLNGVALSVALAFLMLYIALGLVFLVQRGNPVPMPFTLLIFAISFVICTVYYKSRGGGAIMESLFRGCFLAICTTFALIAVIGGLILTMEGKIPELNMMISILALCIVISMVLLSLREYMLKST